MKHPGETTSGIKHEPGMYEWPCRDCGRVFLPLKVFWRSGPRHQVICATCAWKNLEKFLAEPESIE